MDREDEAEPDIARLNLKNYGNDLESSNDKYMHEIYIHLNRSRARSRS